MIVGTAHAYDNAEFVVEPEKSLGSITSKPAQTSVDLPNGGVIRFVEITDDRGRLSGVAVVEVRLEGETSIHEIAGLENANSMEIFHAVSARGTKPPRSLTKAYGDTRPKHRQGWARLDMAIGFEHGGGGLICPQTNWSWSSFENLILGENLPLVFLSEGDGPSTTLHWFGMGGFVSNYDKLVGRVDNVSAFTTSVLLCELDEQSRAFHPWIMVRYRKQSVGVSAVSEEIFNAGDQVTFSWHPIFNPISDDLEIGEQYDFELWVGYALGIDKFYIGANWSKPFESLAPN